jgi:hypothetical protein
VRRHRSQGRRTRLVRARLDHHRAGAGSFRVLRQRRGIGADPGRPTPDAKIAGATGLAGTFSQI